ncbi:hypothetical protein [Pseudoalteromonas aurantia]|uniref:N-acetyltransferase domain-containing protein n=1 Tax=Pseudoalteromonas aurantia 208 TaxID=1314867 RepID=A0ABR9E7K9_9GAMM|nr:hypothetical protein [Pseudoalteromonas aurantia]MBE0366986.1 hypothetical protein [Pseudoalteromonas aurantia 208]
MLSSVLFSNLCKKASDVNYVPWHINVIGGIEGLSHYLHHAYCTDDSAVYLGWVCPQCKGNDFSLSKAVYRNREYCPVCTTKLTSFWSLQRTQYYFMHAQQPFGYFATKHLEVQGLIWGYKKPLHNLSNEVFYIDMVVINKSLHKTKTGISIVLNLIKTLSNYAAQQGFDYLAGRTQVDNSPLISVFKLIDAQIFGPDPTEPKTRTLWIKPLYP